MDNVFDALERSPVIAATDRNGWQKAVLSEAEVLFHLGANIMSVSKDIQLAKEQNKAVFIHVDLADGFGRDRTSVEWLKYLGADGIITTRTQLVKSAHDCGMLAVQRFFVLDTKGMHSIAETIENSSPDLIEIMPGVIPKALRLFANRKTPVIAGGLIEKKERLQRR